MVVIYAPNKITTSKEQSAIKIFMAGSIEMGTAPDWQSELSKIFEDNDPDEFWRKGNVDIVCSRFNIPLYESFEKGVGRLATVLRSFNK